MAKKAKAQAASPETAQPSGQGVETPDVFDQAIAAQKASQPNSEEAPDDAAGQPRQWTDRGPVGRHAIDLGDGRVLRFSRWDRWQQHRVEFTAKKEEVDPRPDKEDTEFLKANGFRWRSEDKAWTRQIFSDVDKAKIADVEKEEGKEEAGRLRSGIRGASDEAAQAAFVQLANRIRERNGLAAVEYSAGQEHSR